MVLTVLLLLLIVGEDVKEEGLQSGHRWKYSHPDPLLHPTHAQVRSIMI